MKNIINDLYSVKRGTPYKVRVVDIVREFTKGEPMNNTAIHQQVILQRQKQEALSGLTWDEDDLDFEKFSMELELFLEEYERIGRTEISIQNDEGGCFVNDVEVNVLEKVISLLCSFPINNDETEQAISETIKGIEAVQKILKSKDYKIENDLKEESVRVSYNQQIDSLEIVDKDEIIACLQALSRIEGATFDVQFKSKNDFISKNIEFVSETLLKMLEIKC